MLLTLFCSLSLVIPELPPPVTADTEVSTNIPVVVDFSEMSRLTFTLSLVATPTNALEVSIGCDADGDGHLSVEESAYTFGYDCGNWFRRTGATDVETVELACQGGASQHGRLERSFVLKRGRLSAASNLVKVTRRGAGGVMELTKVEGSTPGLRLMIR